MTSHNQQNTPPAVNASANREYLESAKRLKWAFIALEIMGVMFTLPHNLKAFGIGIEAFTATMLLNILGVAVLEGVFLFGMSHFTHGWIASKPQERMAWATWGIVTLFLASNAVVSELPAEVTTFYRDFILPSTPIVSLVLGGLLLSLHPQVQETARTFNHIATVSRKNQEAELALLQAKNAVRLQEMEAKQQEFGAELTARQIDTQAKLDTMLANAKQNEAVQKFAVNAQQTVFNEKEKALNTALSSQEFKSEISEVVNAEVKRMASVAITEAQTAQMWAVKAITWKF